MNLSPECEFLLYCIRGEIDTGSFGRVRSIIDSDLNWGEVMELAQRHGSVPLLYHRLKGIKNEIPQSVMQKLKAGYYLNIFRNEHLYHELSKILKILKDDGIEPIILKGAALAATVYQDKALRFFGDIDLLIRKTDLSRTGKKLFEIGYKQNVQLSIEKQCGMSRHLVPFQNPDKDTIEVHWTLCSPAYPYTIDIDGLWKRARPLTTAGVLILCPEDSLIHQCLHISCDLFCGGLRHLYDISQTLHYYGDEINWEQVTLRTREWKIKKCVYLTLRLAEEVLQVSIPATELEALKPDNFDPQVIDLAIEQFFINTIVLKNPIALLWVTPHLKDKIAILQRGVLSLGRIAKNPANLKNSLLTYYRTVWRLLSHDKELLDYGKVLNRQKKNNDVLRDFFHMKVNSNSQLAPR